LLNKDKTLNEALNFLINPKLELLLTLWRTIDDNRMVRRFYKKSLEQVNLHLKIYVPRIFSSITLDSIYQEINEKMISK
jgi:hypothetical protein